MRSKVFLGLRRVFGWQSLSGLLVGLTLAACGPAETEAPVEVVRPAKLVEITRRADHREVRLPAVIEAAASADVTFQVGGSLQELLVTAGQEVAEGDVLARLDPRDYQNALGQAQAQFDAANGEFQRAQRLIGDNAISQSVFDQRKSSRDIALAALDTARKALEDTVLKSPFDGVVATVYADQFQNVGPQQNIVTIQTTGAAEALVHMPTTLIAYSRNINPIETHVTLDAAPDLEIPAEFFSISTQADAATQTFAVKFSFTPPDSIVILPGMAGTISSTLEIADQTGQVDRIYVPLSAVFAEGDERFVWVVDKETMKVSKRTIELGESIGETLIVQSGLEVGETIVGAGASYLFEGLEIRPYEG